MARPRISIIIATHNGAAFLERAICSVLDQEHPAFELIVIDAGSSDGTPELIRLYERRIAAWRRLPPTSAPEAVNLGLSCARGRIIGILPAFALYLPGSLRAVEQSFSRDNAMRWLIGTSLCLGGRDRVIGRREGRAPQTLAEWLSGDGPRLPGASSFFRRELFDWYGLFDTTLPRGWRYEHACRLLAHGESPQVERVELAAARPVRRFGTVSIRHDLQHLAAVRRYATWVADADRRALAASARRRHREGILALARARGGVQGRRLIMHHLLRRPAWLGDDAVRRFLNEHAIPAR